MTPREGLLIGIIVIILAGFIAFVASNVYVAEHKPIEPIEIDLSGVQEDYKHLFELVLHNQGEIELLKDEVEFLKRVLDVAITRGLIR